METDIKPAADTDWVAMDNDPDKAEPTTTAYGRFNGWYDALPARVRRCALAAYILLITLLLAGNVAAWYWALFAYHLNQSPPTGQ